MLKRKTQKGFTLIELLIVIAIIGILAAIVLVSLSGARPKAQKAAFKSEVAGAHAGMVTICDDRDIETTDFPNGGADTTVTAWSAATIDSQSCGTTGDGTFSISGIAPLATIADCTTAGLSEAGADFASCL
jgi:prepilin-type N-terminal cleavage/methylation domain-containing protein